MLFLAILGLIVINVFSLNTPGQTDMPVEALEATVKAITLIEDFTDFDTQLPNPR